MSELNDYGKKFLSSQEIEIIDIVKGKEEKKRIHFGKLYIINQSTTKAIITNKNVKYPAFIITLEKEYENILAIMNYEISCLIDTPHLISYLLQNEKQEKAVLSLWFQDDYEIFISYEELITNALNGIKRGITTTPTWLYNIIKLPKTTSENPLTSEEDIYKLIASTIESMVYKYKLDDKSKNLLTKKFISMLLCDYISLNKNRNINTYGIFYNKIRENIRITPLYYCSVDSKLLKEDQYLFNNKIIDIQAFISTVIKYYYKAVEPIIDGIIENRVTYEKCLNLIANAKAYQYKNKIINNISDRLDILTSIANQYSHKEKESKIDLVTTRTNINLKVINQAQEIIDKYQNYKNELITEELPKAEIKVTKEKENYSFIIIFSLIIFIFIISFILYLLTIIF